jgi:tetratricopeptide (TPR) repeat protein
MGDVSHFIHFSILFIASPPAYGQKSEKSVKRPLLILLLAGVVGSEDAGALAREAFAKYRQAEARQDGWAAVYDEGIALAEKAVALDPQSADAHYALFLNLGRKSERSGLTAQAQNIGRLRKLLDRTLELDPKHAHAWEAQGEMLQRLPWFMGGSKRKGEEALRHAAELDPRWPKPRLRLAQYYFDEGRSEEARTEAERARDLAVAAGDEDWRSEAEHLLSEISSGS